ncbi:synaptotagmin-3-like isoform X1 [Gossypium australe]|uniref:Synaptotagmin-3-like isoform X1 n=1 Tax=Gossypium australe TaxID=47621 RepID=A0A5B6V693_9ROSI|nr:synaptotagmin-3-like isoform X1 [Gossypium australe]
MAFLSTLTGIIGFGMGVPFGLLLGFYFFIYSKPKIVQEPITRRVSQLDNTALLNLLHDIPLWVKCPDYERVDWLNKIIADMWPYLNKIKTIAFENLSLGTIPPDIYGFKICETNENELVLEPAVRWAGNPNIVVDMQILVAPRVTLKPLVPTIPCFANASVSLLKRVTRDRLRIECSWRGSYVYTRSLSYYPGAVPRTIKMQIASLYLWPQSLEIPILDPSTVAINKPVGILHVKVVRAHKLLKMDFLGTSDPYVKLNLTGENLPAKKTSIKKRNLNPVWNEKFKLVVKDPESQVLQLEVFDWDKVGTHDRLGMQFVPLKLLTANETKEFKLDLLKHTFIADPYDKKPRGNIVIELTYAPFREESIKVDGIGDILSRKESSQDRPSENSSHEVLSGAGLLSVTVQGAEDVEGLRHNNPYAVIRFRGDKKKTKKIKKTRHPLWNEEFQFMLEEPPLNDTIRIQVMSRRKGIGFHSKECLGKLDINLTDVVHNGRINTKYHLMNSKNGKIHVDIKWTTV